LKNQVKNLFKRVSQPLKKSEEFLWRPDACF
jgi:hypothetical protein